MATKITQEDKQRILDSVHGFIVDTLYVHHRKNTEKCRHLKAFKINPLLLHYVASYGYGNDTAENLAKALVYPRVLCTSINTSFGTLIQDFCHQWLKEVYPTGVDGMDLEFNDAIDGRHKLCQLKAGPETINQGDPAVIVKHFKDYSNRAKKNGDKTFNFSTDGIVGIVYGTHDQINSWYKEIEKEGLTIYCGKEFWLHLTGDESFYDDLIAAFSDAGAKVKGKALIRSVIKDLNFPTPNFPVIPVHICFERQASLPVDFSRISCSRQRAQPESC